METEMMTVTEVVTSALLVIFIVFPAAHTATELSAFWFWIGVGVVAEYWVLVCPVPEPFDALGTPVLQQ